MKRVRVTLDLSESFIRLMNTNVQLSGGMEPERELDVAQQLVRVVCAEARGAVPEHVHKVIQHQFRADIHVVEDERRVFEDGAQIAGPELEAVAVIG